MSSNVCQRLQSCLDPMMIEPRPSKIKLDPAKLPSFSRSFRLSPTDCLPRYDLKKPEQKSLDEQNNGSSSKDGDDADLEGHKNGELDGWDFVQALTNPSYAFKEAIDNEKSYVHPLMKRSTSMILDQKSLEMCTESLGSETGSFTSTIDDEALFLSRTVGKKFTARELPKDPETGATKPMNRSRSFPPPLSSISSSDCVQVRPHRSGGRLVIKVTTSHSYFHAERGDGRLRLRFLKGCSRNFEDEDFEDDDDDDEVEGFEGAEEEEEEYCEDSDSLYWCEDTEANSTNVGVDIGIENLHRPTRCMEGVRYGDNSLLSCETLWVAT